MSQLSCNQFDSSAVREILYALSVSYNNTCLACCLGILFPPAPSTLCSSTTRPRRFCATGLGPSAVAPRLLQPRPRRPPGGDTDTIAESPARGGETRARSETMRPCNSRRTTPETCSRWSPTFHHALHCAPAATATSSNQEPSGELVTVHSLSPHLVHGIAYRQN